MITPSFAPTATERVLPKLALDFTTASLDSRITFTRTTGASNPATYINSSGVITAATNNQPRFDYTLNTGGSCNGLLIEESRANLAIYSQSPTNWFKAGTATVSGVSETSPDGTSNAYAISSCNAYANRFGASSALTITGGSTITFSVYLKANGNGTSAVLGLATAGGTYKEQFSTLTITSSWARYSITMTTNANNTGVFWIVYGGTATTAMVPWGAQIEVGAFATSYIPTTTTALTRNADVATMTGTNFSDWFNATEGSFEVDFNPYVVTGAGTQQSILSVSDGTINNTMDIYKRNNADMSTRLNVVAATASQVFLNAGALSTGNNKIAMAYKLDSYAYCKNAASILTDTVGTVPSVDRLAIGIDSQTSVFALSGWIQRLKYWPQRLINAEVQAFSK